MEVMWLFTVILASEVDLIKPKIRSNAQEQ